MSGCVVAYLCWELLLAILLNTYSLRLTQDDEFSKLYTINLKRVSLPSLADLQGALPVGALSQDYITISLIPDYFLR